MPKILDDIGKQSIGGSCIRGGLERLQGLLHFLPSTEVVREDVRSRPINQVVAEVKLFKRKGTSSIAIGGGTTSFYECDPS